MRRRPVFATFCAAIAASVVLVPAGSPATKTPPRCQTSGLVVWLNTEGDGTAGSIYYKLEFTNLTGSTCTLTGYPGVSAVDLTGHQLGSPAGHDTFAAPHTVTLAGGATKTATLRIAEAGNFPASQCHMVPAAGVRVYPPNQTASKLVPFPFSACSHTGPAVLSVRVVA